MLNEKTVERLNVLLARITRGPLSGGGELQRQIFISTIDQIISEEKSDSHRRIIFLENELKTITDSVKRMHSFLQKMQEEIASEELSELVENSKIFTDEVANYDVDK
jgi:hypothetical protein